MFLLHDVTGQTALNLTPYVPLSLRGRMKERGKSLQRGGFAPSLNSLPLPFLREGGQGDRLLNTTSL
jgi:hypothetical protein